MLNAKCVVKYHHILYIYNNFWGKTLFYDDNYKMIMWTSGPSALGGTIVSCSLCDFHSMTLFVRIRPWFFVDNVGFIFHYQYYGRNHRDYSRSLAGGEHPFRPDILIVITTTINIIINHGNSSWVYSGGEHSFRRASGMSSSSWPLQLILPIGKSARLYSRWTPFQNRLYHTTTIIIINNKLKKDKRLKWTLFNQD